MCDYSRAEFSEIFARQASSWEPRTSGNTVGAGLALSGGGYRAMLFHAGSLRRLHEVGALQRLTRISSVSGGSIAAAVLAESWEGLRGSAGDPEIFRALVQDRLLEIARHRIDVASVLKGLLTPLHAASDSVASHFERLFPSSTLQDLPDNPRFVFCATNLGTGSLVRFSKPYSADQRVGKRDGLDLPLSVVLAASAAFPPFLSPMRIQLSADYDLSDLFPGSPPELAGVADYSSQLELTDGGVYDNLGLQPLEQLHTVLVSDGGGPFQFEPKVRSDWLRHMVRSWKVTDNQVRSLRRKHFVAELENGRRNGAFWSVGTPYSRYAAGDLRVHDGWSRYLRTIPTRLHPMPLATQRQLVNFSYCVADASIRKHLASGRSLPPMVIPFPEESLSEAPPAKEFDAPAVWKVWE